MWRHGRHHVLQGDHQHAALASCALFHSQGEAVESARTRPWRLQAWTYWFLNLQQGPTQGGPFINVGNPGFLLWELQQKNPYLELLCSYRLVFSTWAVFYILQQHFYSQFLPIATFQKYALRIIPRSQEITIFFPLDMKTYFFKYVF